MNKNTSNKLPQIPNKRYFTIGEVGNLCSVKPHVLRYWEQEFPQLRPSKRRGNRRYYQREDVIMVRNIRGLLYDEGYTISGARIQLDVVVKQQKQDFKAEQKAKAITNSYTFNFRVEPEDIDAGIVPATEVNPAVIEPSFIIENIPEEMPAPTPNQTSAAKSISQPLEKLKNYRLLIDEAVIELNDILRELQTS